MYQIEELPDLKVAWHESYKCFNEPLLEYVWEVANQRETYPLKKDTKEAKIHSKGLWKNTKNENTESWTILSKRSF